jgi:predicted amidohydrolase
VNVLGLQLDIVWENPRANHDKVRHLLTGVEPGTLVVLPEMFSLGFTLAELEDRGETVAALAKECRVNILAGLKRDRRNEAVLFDANGRELARYAKMHPFQVAGENVVPGAEPVVVPCGEFRLAPAVCYDLRFPELFRAAVKRGANLFAVIANWPTSRLDHWLTLLKARAIENQAYVIGVNRCGRDPNADYPGRSQIIGPRGEVLADAGEAEGVVQAELDLPELEAYRQKFPLLDDMRL